MNRLSVWGKVARKGKGKGGDSLQCRRILGGQNLVRVRNIVVVAIILFGFICLSKKHITRVLMTLNLAT